jgi:hypothetical protein
VHRSAVSIAFQPSMLTIRAIGAPPWGIRRWRDHAARFAPPIQPVTLAFHPEIRRVTAPSGCGPRIGRSERSPRPAAQVAHLGRRRGARERGRSRGELVPVPLRPRRKRGRAVLRHALRLRWSAVLGRSGSNAAPAAGLGNRWS